MDEMVAALRDLEHSIREFPAEWPEDLLVEAEQLARRLAGNAATERLTRALTT